MVYGFLWDMSLPMISKMENLNVKTFLFLLQVLVYATAAGTKGGSGNQWNQNPQERRPQTKGPLGGWDDEVTNPRGGYPEEGSNWKLEDSIPGIPGQSFPNFGKIPETSFDCRKQKEPGYYGDLETQCQVFHICQTDGRHNSFLCPIGTIFNQQAFVCDWWFNVNCADSTLHSGRNGNLYKSAQIGIDGSKVSSYGGQPGQGTKGNDQQPAVGIPVDSVSNGGNWPSLPQGQSQGGWGAANQGNQKGDNRPVNQRRMMTGGQNRGPANAKGNQGMGNTGRGQKGSRGGQHPNMGGWQQQGGRMNQKGGNVQGSVGMNNQEWNQRGGMNRRMHPNREQMFHPQGGMKGGSMHQRRPNAQDGFPRMGGNVGGQGGRRMGNNRGGHSSKGFDNNRWSIRSQNFQQSTQDRKGSSSDIWPNNRNAEDRPQMENPLPFQAQLGNQNIDFRSQHPNSGYADRQDQNNDWGNDDENYPQWDGNADKRNRYEYNENMEGNSENAHNWNSNSNAKKEVSWQHNREFSRHQAENDYDYS